MKECCAKAINPRYRIKKRCEEVLLNSKGNNSDDFVFVNTIVWKDIASSDNEEELKTIVAQLNERRDDVGYILIDTKGWGCDH